MNDYLVISQNIFLILSNFSLVPAIYQAWKGRYFGESITYLITMFASSVSLLIVGVFVVGLFISFLFGPQFYHLCDNERIRYCIAGFKTLQFLDFFSAILALWCTAIILAPVPPAYISAFHLTGSLFFAALLFSTSVTGFWSFALPAFCSVTLLLIVWGRRYWLKRRLPELVYTWHFYVAVVLSLVGAILFGIQMTPKLEKFYGYTHSAWHVCMAVAIVFLLPRGNRQEFAPIGETVSESVLALNSANADRDEAQTTDGGVGNSPMVQTRLNRKISDIFCFDNLRFVRPSVTGNGLNEINAGTLLKYSNQTIPQTTTTEVERHTAIILPSSVVLTPGPSRESVRPLSPNRATSLMMFDDYPPINENSSIRRHQSLRGVIV